MLKHKISFLLLATILASSMAFLDGTALNVALPVIQERFNTTLMGLQWIVDGYALSLAALLLTAGSLSDLFGQRKMFIIGMIVFVFFSMACGLAQSTLELIIARVLQGLGAAFMIPGSLAIINFCVAKKERGRAIGIWAGVSGGIASIGPFIGGWLTQTLSWRYIFFINLPIGIIAILLTLKFVPITSADLKRKIDWLGTFMIILTLTALSFGLIEGPNLGWDNFFILICLSLGGIGLIAFILIQIYSKHAMIPFVVFENKNVIVANLITFFIYFSLNAFIFFVVLFLQQVQNYTPIQTGLALLPAFIILTFLTGFGGMVADKIGVKIPLIVGSLVVALSFLMLMLSTKLSSYWLSFFPGASLFGLGMAIIIAPVTKAALDVSENLSGTASGINNAISRTAALLAVAIIGAFAITLYSDKLHSLLTASHLHHAQAQAILMQVHKLANITIPSTFMTETQALVKVMIYKSFYYSYHWVLILCVIFSLIASFFAFFLHREH